jgi:nucleoside-diphosphate-sugar epimerase
MKVFLTGATGVIGRRLVPLLIKAGHHVEGVARTQKSWKTLGQAENQAQRFTDAGGAGVVLRFGLFYGPDSGHTLDMVRFVKKWIRAFNLRPRCVFGVKLLKDVAYDRRTSESTRSTKR